MDKTVWFIRHGETEWNSQIRWQGHTDVPLNETGRQQASGVALQLKDRPLKAILSSDLSRARETAEIIAAPHGIPVFTTEQLREVNIGDAEGLTTPEVLERFGEISVQQWRTLENMDSCLPGGETKRQALKRGLTAVQDFVSSESGKELAIVFHSLIMRLILYHLFPAVQGPLHITNCKFFQLRFNGGSSLWTAEGELLAHIENAAVNANR